MCACVCVCTLLQGLFPAIDIGTVHLASCQRVVLFHLDKVCEVCVWGQACACMYVRACTQARFNAFFATVNPRG